jgi:hypothetical protein
VSSGLTKAVICTFAIDCHEPHQDVPDLTAALTDDGERRHPRGGAGRRILLIEELATDTVRVTLRGNRAVPQMGRRKGATWM